MVERGQQVGLAFEILDDRLADERVGREVDHFLDRHQFDHVGEMQVAGAVNRAHAAHPDHFLDQVALRKCRASLQLSARRRVVPVIQWLGDAMCVQGHPPAWCRLYCAKTGLATVPLGVVSSFLQACPHRLPRVGLQLHLQQGCHQVG